VLSINATKVHLSYVLTFRVQEKYSSRDELAVYGVK
jgi:hypothetical protein